MSTLQPTGWTYCEIATLQTSKSFLDHRPVISWPSKAEEAPRSCECPECGGPLDKNNSRNFVICIYPQTDSFCTRGTMSVRTSSSGSLKPGVLTMHTTTTTSGMFCIAICRQLLSDRDWFQVDGWIFTIGVYGPSGIQYTTPLLDYRAA